MTKTVAVVCVVFLAACGGKEGPPGPQGDKGDPGAPGAAGPAGAAGPGLNQTVNYGCLNTSLGALHDIYKFPDGSIMTSCQMIWSVDGTASGFALWRTGQPGTSSAYCQTVASGGSWAEFEWNGNLASTMTVHGSTTQTYTLNCTKY